jgi:hypothetical protein
VPLTLLGIDEAGYGPILGPLCVGMASVHVADWVEGDPAPDLWKVLSAAVCQKPSDKRHRVAIADSKKLKLPNDASGDRHPLMHLERGVLAMLAAHGREPSSPTDAALFDALAVQVPPHPWYAGEPMPLPMAHGAGAIRIASNMLSVALSATRVGLGDLRCEVICEQTLNRLAAEHGTKAAATAEAIGRHLRRAWLAQLERPEEPAARVVIDRQGGRAQYGPWLANLLPESIGAGRVVILEERDDRSSYQVLDAGGKPRLVVHLNVEGEQASLCVALASMTAKLVRELLMARLNRYWLARAAAHGREVKPTAGYYADGTRWLSDMETVVTREERRGLVRTV